jgi:hypothetical protein
MPIVTQSMAKHHASGNAKSESFVAHSLTVNLENTMLSATVTTSSNDTSLPSFLALPVGSPSTIIENQFEISNAKDLEFSNFCHPCTALITHPSSQNFQMESKCDKSATTMKVDPDPPDSQTSPQDGIMKMLMAISSQMLANTKDLQDQITKYTLNLQTQLVQHNLKLTLKLTHEIQRINQEHAAFKQKIQNYLPCLQNSGVLSGSSLVNNVAGLPSTVFQLILHQSVVMFFSHRCSKC